MTFGGKHLTADGLTKLRAEIRGERKARWDYYSGHITLLIGLLGALIGVIVYNRFNLVFIKGKVVQYQSRSALSRMRFCDAVLRYGTID